MKTQPRYTVNLSTSLGLELNDAELEQLSSLEYSEFEQVMFERADRSKLELIELELYCKWCGTYLMNDTCVCHEERCPECNGNATHTEYSDDWTREVPCDRCDGRGSVVCTIEHPGLTDAQLRAVGQEQ